MQRLHVIATLGLLCLLPWVVPGSALADPGHQTQQWPGAPCLTDADCGKLRCCNGACAASCRTGKDVFCARNAFRALGAPVPAYPSKLPADAPPRTETPAL